MEKWAAETLKFEELPITDTILLRDSGFLCIWKGCWEERTLQLRCSDGQKNIRGTLGPGAMKIKKSWVIMITLSNASEHANTLNKFT